MIIWNGTGTIETQKLVWEIFDKDIYIVNESWASVYSVSKIAEEEFPNLDSLDRWTISLGRRYLDPLSELVKVPVWSIWVGMYQHDVSEKKTRRKTRRCSCRLCKWGGNKCKFSKYIFT